ncbi:MAG: hypothetical protein ACOXZV_00655 [Bacteroidales bacterium]|jgi:hypothetical protein
MNTDKLLQLGVCNEAIRWASRQRNPKSAWSNCKRGDWMLWLAGKLKVDDKLFILVKCRCADMVKHLITDPEIIKCLEKAREYSNRKLKTDNFLESINKVSIEVRKPKTYFYNEYYAINVVYTAVNFFSPAATSLIVTFIYYALIFDGVRYEDINKSVADICREYLTTPILEAYENL